MRRDEAQRAATGADPMVTEPRQAGRRTGRAADGAVPARRRPHLAVAAPFSVGDLLASEAPAPVGHDAGTAMEGADRAIEALSLPVPIGAETSRMWNAVRRPVIAAASRANVERVGDRAALPAAPDRALHVIRAEGRAALPGLRVALSERS